MRGGRASKKHEIEQAKQEKRRRKELKRAARKASATVHWSAKGAT